ncbi:UPF0280 family protein [Marispirochaeta sp.]|jgi:uncharacterized protein|uniref:UPF0280 family protein n=1 Tax=Marispirochaeta sp. TaxID=2038653 RepID=UPI0029C91A14|nr:UPF0280 family protein [Marispirochaeta sp.]
MRTFTEFRYREAAFIVATERFDVVRATVKKLRRQIQGYIEEFPEFLHALEPLKVLPGDPPEPVQRMHTASQIVGVGPMAAVAGTVAQMAAEAAREAGCSDTIINNGGDIFLNVLQDAYIGIYGGENEISGKIAFKISAEDTPLALCSSSSQMGHSRSFGNCSLATVTADNASLADAAATLAGNLSKDPASARAAAERIANLPGVRGVLILVEDSVAMAGELPELISCDNSRVRARILRHPLSFGVRRFSGRKGTD